MQVDGIESNDLVEIPTNRISNNVVNSSLSEQLKYVSFFFFSFLN